MCLTMSTFKHLKEAKPEPEKVENGVVEPKTKPEVIFVQYPKYIFVTHQLRKL